VGVGPGIEGASGEFRAVIDHDDLWQTLGSQALKDPPSRERPVTTGRLRSPRTRA
jgi:hypothetical protein